MVGVSNECCKVRLSIFLLMINVNDLGKRLEPCFLMIQLKMLHVYSHS